METKIRRGRPLVEIKKTDDPEYAKNYYHLSNVRCDCVCGCLLYTSPSPRDRQRSRMPSSA